MRSPYRLSWLAAGGLLFVLACEPAARDQKPYDLSLVEADQELNQGVATDAYKGIHVLSPTMRGVRAAQDVIYWVSPDGTSLSAYQGDTQLWHTPVAAAFAPELPQPQITKLVLSQQVLFVAVNDAGMVEVDRRTGQLSQQQIIRD